MALVTPIARAIARALAIPIAGTGGASRQYYQFDGVNDYVSVPSISLFTGYEITGVFIAPTSVNAGNATVVSGGGTNYLDLESSGNYGFKGKFGNTDIDTYVDGVKLVGNVSYPTDGLPHTFSLIFNVDGYVLTQISGFNLTSRIYNNIIYDVIVSNGTTNIHNWPINDSWANNPVIADSLADRSSVLSNEDSNFLSGNSWILSPGTQIAEIVGDELHIASADGSSSNAAVFDLVVGNVYDLSVNVTSITGAGYIGNGSLSFNSVGMHTFRYEASSTTLLISRSGICDFTMSDTSAVRVTDGTAINFQEPNWVSTL